MDVRRGEWRSTGAVWQDGAAESGGAGRPAYEEAIVRNAVHKLVGVALIGLLGAFALPMLAAGAQTNGSTGSNGVPPDPPGACTFDVHAEPDRRRPDAGDDHRHRADDRQRARRRSSRRPGDTEQSGTDMVETDPSARLLRHAASGHQRPRRRAPGFRSR